MIEDSELKIGGQTFKGAWIAVVLAIGSTIGGGVWTASSLYSRLEAVESQQQQLEKIILQDIPDIRERVIRLEVLLEKALDN